MASLAPSPNLSVGTRSPGKASIKDLLAERQRNSPIPPPSPALSDGAFSVWESPATAHSAVFNSPTFHFEAHYGGFIDEPVTPELAGRRSDEAGEVVFDPAQHEDADEDDVAFPPAPPLPAADPPIPPSPASRNDRLSIQSATVTDGFSDCSPSPSIGSVRMAKIHKIPHPSRLSVSTASVSDSAEDAPEDDADGHGSGAVWDAKALARTSFVDRLPQELAAILQVNEAARETERAETTVSAGQAFLSPVPLPQKDAPPPPEKRHASSVAQSSSRESELSSESWRVHLEESVKSLSPDPSIKPEADAMQRMKSILGAKTRIISKAPWDGETEDGADGEPPARRSVDVLSHRTTASADHRKALKQQLKENVKPAKGARTRSFSVLTSRRANTLDSKEQDEALKGLGLGLGTTLSGSDSKRSLKSLLKASTALAESESFSDFASNTPPQTVRAAKQSSPAALPSTSRPTPERVDSASKMPRAARVPASVVFEMVAQGAPLASPTSAAPPMSAPASITVFSDCQAAPSRSGSKASLGVVSAKRQNSGNSTTTPSPSTPSALAGVLSNPTSPGPGSPSYFTAVPGSSKIGASSASPSGFGHKLISLEEAKLMQDQDRERAAAAARTRESTADSLPQRRGVPGPASIQTSSPSPAPAPLPPPARELKPKKSGFLRRMMGGGDKHERPEMPSPPVPESLRARPSLSSSASIPTIAATPPSSLGRAAGLKLTESPASMGPARVSFLPSPSTESSQRTRKGAAVPAPALSLRPVSMAFSAGLPTDFLAAPSASSSSSSPNPAPAKPTPTSRSASSSSSPPHSHIPLASPQASSFNSSTSTSATSLFDEACPPSGSTTPLTPSFFNSSLLGSGIDEKERSAVERLAAVQDEYARAKRGWMAHQLELEAQVRSLQVELDLQMEENERERERGKTPMPPLKEGEACDRCGNVVRVVPLAADARPPGSTSVMQRPKFKGNGGIGTLFGSGVVA
ncbi:hypothetical protein JCM10213_004781 [Rhodosporidiobolus nylandii]